jgi:hypothetical protein
LSAAFGDLVCEKCGKIEKSEFSPEARTKMGTVLLLKLLVIAVFALAIVSVIVAVVTGK